MTKYANLNGNSNVEAYDIGLNYIAVKFYGTAEYIDIHMPLPVELMWNKQRNWRKSVVG